MGVAGKVQPLISRFDAGSPMETTETRSDDEKGIKSCPSPYVPKWGRGDSRYVISTDFGVAPSSTGRVACGLGLGLALISAENPGVEMASKQLLQRLDPFLLSERREYNPTRNGYSPGNTQQNK